MEYASLFYSLTCDQCGCRVPTTLNGACLSCTIDAIDEHTPQPTIDEIVHKFYPSYEPNTCDHCSGDGIVPMVECARCHGDGNEVDECPTCEGDGVMPLACQGCTKDTSGETCAECNPYAL